MVDTSASQTGIYRSNSQQIVASLIERLPAGHSVMVVAVDTTYAPITSGFVATGSEELRAALSGLKKRTPMGSTDLHGAIRKAFADQPLAPNVDALHRRRDERVETASPLLMRTNLSMTSRSDRSRFTPF